MPRPTINLREQIGYTWQLYLPRLPFMLDQFGYFPPYEVWFRGFIGKFGWLDTYWGVWPYRVAFGIYVPITVLAGLALWRRRTRAGGALAELLTYAVLALGVMGSIGFLGIRFTRDTGFDFAQARYLFPFLSFYAAFVALAALGAGRRYGRLVGAVFVLLRHGARPAGPAPDDLALLWVAGCASASCCPVCGPRAASALPGSTRSSSSASTAWRRTSW